VPDSVTGNAVVVELRPARLASRSVALAIDIAVMLAAFAVLLVVLSLAGVLGDFDPALAAAVAVVVTVSVFVGYPVTVETLSRGRSLGKLVMGLRVVREDGGPIRFRHALTRGLVGFVVDFGVLSAFTGAIGLISSLVSAHGRRIGDLLAGTLVVRERTPKPGTADIRMPPELATWAASLSLSGLPDGLALRVRDFLRRAPALTPKARTALGGSLAAEVTAHTDPPPPPGTPPEAHLAAVIAERRRREDDRLAAQQPPPAVPEQSPPPADPSRWRDVPPAPPPTEVHEGFTLPR
jgi:uncharacterized RDD family membrane protein YckC